MELGGSVGAGEVRLLFGDVIRGETVVIGHTEGGGGTCVKRRLTRGYRTRWCREKMKEKKRRLVKKEKMWRLVLGSGAAALPQFHRDFNTYDHLYTHNLLPLQTYLNNITNTVHTLQVFQTCEISMGSEVRGPRT